MSRTQKLSQEQVALAKTYVKRWLDVCYSTEPLDRGKAEEAVAFLYREFAEKDKPSTIVWCDSPLQAQMEISARKKVDESFRKEKEGLSSDMNSEIDDFVCTEYGGLCDSLHSHSDLETEPLQDLVNRSFNKNINEIANALKTDLMAHTSTAKLPFRNYVAPVWAHQAVCEIDFLLNEFVTTEDLEADSSLKEEINKFKELSQALGHLHIIVPFNDVCFVVDRPVRLELEEQVVEGGYRGLSRIDGVALEYRDGYGVYAFEGKRYGTLVEVRMAAEARGGEEKAS